MTAFLDTYRLARQAQDERFNNRPGAGGIDASMTNTEEYRQYFGIGKEWCGRGVEERLTYKLYLQQVKRERIAAEAYAESEGFDMTTATTTRKPRTTRKAPATVKPEPITMESAFWLSGAQLATLAAAGDVNAREEITRRAIKRAAKTAAKVAS